MFLSRARRLNRQVLSQALEQEADGRPLLARVRLTGGTAIHNTLAEGHDALREEIRAIVAALSETLWLEKVVLATHAPPTVNSAAPADDFEALLAALTDDSAIHGELNADITDFLSKAPAELDQDVELIAEALRARLGGRRPG